MQRSYEYTVLDVFAEQALEGNPLAVFHDARGLSDEEMQALARETRLSETTFILPTDDEPGAVRVRIFTTEEELPFAGHPTLGTASWLYQNHPTLRGAQQITLQLNVGPIPVHFPPHEQHGNGVFGSMRQNDPVFGGTYSPDEVAPVLGLAPEEIDARFLPQSVSTGNAFCIVLLKSLDSLQRLAIPQALASPWLRERGMRWFYVLAPTGQEGEFRTRMQFYSGEDPATGSAAGPAVAWLVANGLLAPDAPCRFLQGVEMLRPSLLLGRAQKQADTVYGIDIAGRTISVAMGRYFLPGTGTYAQG